MNVLHKIRSIKLPSYVANRYAFAVLIFLIWMLFFDQNNLILQVERQRNLKKSKLKKAYYEKSIQETNHQLNELLTNGETLEKFGREKYYMKKKDEDIFILVPSSDQKN